MTKDWDSVRSRIRHLSVNQKKSLEEVKATMESQYHFRASTRAYRMKLKEWGYTRQKSRRGTIDPPRKEQDPKETRDDSDGESDRSAAGHEQRGVEENVNTEALMQEAEESVEPFVMSYYRYRVDSHEFLQQQTPQITPTDQYNSLLPAISPWSQGGMAVSDVVMDMLAEVLANDSQKLEQMILANPNHVNLPIGMPFDAHGGRFFNHPATQQCVILQHANQTILDIACALPSGPVVWVLVGNGANGSTHPLGTDLALHNAIRNGRNMTVQSLLFTNRSSVNGIPGTSWKPLLQATLWNVPDVVRILLDRGASVNDIAPAVAGMPFKSALQLALDWRANNYHNQPDRERCEKIMKMLMDAGANIHVPPTEDLNSLTPFETFIKPWQSNPLWMKNLSANDLYCLEAFIRRGADIQLPFSGFPCSASSGNTFQHQVLWHSTPTIARLLIDHAIPSPEANGSNLLHEVLGSCPDAKRHPVDTLRDIEVLLQRGAGPNAPDRRGTTPLITCIEQCPAVDIVPRLTALLKGGADPELESANGTIPLVRAMRNFEEPLLSQILQLLVSKFRGRTHPGWHGRYFPISSEPTTLAQVLLYTSQNAGFAAESQRMMPEDARPSFQRAAFGVASSNFLDALTNRVRETDAGLTSQEIDELRHVIVLRKAYGLPAYIFDQDVVMTLLTASPAPHHSLTSMMAHPHLSISSPASDLTITPTSFIPATTMPLVFPDTLGAALDMSTSTAIDQPHSTSPHGSSPSSTHSNDDSASSFFPTTTQIRWPNVDTPTKPGDLKKAANRILKYRCKSCTDGNLLTKAEYKRHHEEHWHTITCQVAGCTRRFCVAERG
ncbi:ankyrin [Pleomassaria siparia CBS 279.74]|uniref:Ankyrin n=1 Tax=Pleomassaria siparia CBS 279.74 TaxID=1314801 RepID=A0A6G1KNX4_9PLEO|nr:ankyrin [Pleomassaria siparia CBS 279.74]